MATTRISVFVSFQGDEVRPKAMKTRIEAPYNWTCARLVIAFMKAYDKKYGPPLRTTYSLKLFIENGGSVIDDNAIVGELTTTMLEIRPHCATFQVNLSGTMFKGIGYLGSRGYPPPTASHGTVFQGIRQGDFVRIVHGKYAKCLLPVIYEGYTVITQVPDNTPLDPNGRPRTPVNIDATVIDPQAERCWEEFWAQEASRPDSYYEQVRRDQEQLLASLRTPTAGIPGCGDGSRE